MVGTLTSGRLISVSHSRSMKRLLGTALFSTMMLVVHPVGAQQSTVGVETASDGTRGAARTATIPDAARYVINQTMSPFCPGLTLASCPSPSADSLRRVVVAMAENGDSRDRILDSLSAVFGDGVLGAPRKSGLGLLAWVMPGVILVAGGALLMTWLRSATAKRSATIGRDGQPLVTVAAGSTTQLSNMASDSHGSLRTTSPSKYAESDEELLRQIDALVHTDGA